jgi:putative phosphoesterase
MKIGIISDTHGNLPRGIFDIFRDVKQIFHAGDIGNKDVIRSLEIICPVHAVYGNVDSWPLTIHYPLMLVHEIDNIKICMIHDIINPKQFSYRLFKKSMQVDVVLSGHTHVATFEIFRDVLYINPGSVSKSKDKKYGTVAVMDLGVKPLKPEIIEIVDT